MTEASSCPNPITFESEADVERLHDEGRIDADMRDRMLTHLRSVTRRPSKIPCHFVGTEISASEPKPERVDDGDEDDDGRELSEDDAFTLRRAARIIQTSEHSDDYPETAAALTRLADEYGAPYPCEGCDKPAVVDDAEGTGLCDDCAGDFDE